MSAVDMAARLAKAPNALFGMLCAIELGKPIGDVAKRAGIGVKDLAVLLDQARAGDMPRISAAMGTSVRGETTHSSAQTAKIVKKPDPAPMRIARQEQPPMTQTIPAGIGAKPKLQWVNVDLIDVDKTYQREADRKSVDKIVADFRWDHFGAVVLAAKPDGRFNCTDGQHRVLAALAHPEVDEVPALITSLAGGAAEAENFLTINRARRAVSTIEIYWAGLASGDAATMRVRDVLERAGCHACPTAGDYKPGATMAVSAINRTIERSGEAATVAALKTIRGAWPTDSKALRGTLITALARIHRASTELNQDRLVRVLSSKTYPEITSHAESFRRLSGGSADTVIARTICEIYNRGISSNIIYYGEAA